MIKTSQGRRHKVEKNRYFGSVGIIFLVFVIMILSGCTGEDSGQTVVTTPPADNGGTSQLVVLGEQLFSSKQCTVCHSIDGSAATGPTLKGSFGRTVALDGGGSVTSDEEYLKESILDPDAKIVFGFRKGVMASVVTAGSITDDEADALVAYLKTL